MVMNAAPEPKKLIRVGRKIVEHQRTNRNVCETMTNLEAQDRKRRTPSEGNISCPRELGGSVRNVNGGKLVKC